MSKIPRVSSNPLHSQNPVFFDKSGRRWMLCRATLAAMAFVAIAGAALFVAGLLHDPHFPGIKLDDAELVQQDEHTNRSALRARW